MNLEIFIVRTNNRTNLLRSDPYREYCQITPILVPQKPVYFGHCDERVGWRILSAIFIDQDAEIFARIKAIKALDVLMNRHSGCKLSNIRLFFNRKPVDDGMLTPAWTRCKRRRGDLRASVAEVSRLRLWRVRVFDGTIYPHAKSTNGERLPTQPR